MPILFITIVIDLIGFGLIIPILPFATPKLGGDAFDIALLVAVYSICAGICGPFWGRLSDRFGRKPILLTCLGGGALSYLIMAFSTSLEMLYLSRIAAGIMAGNFGVASAMIADMTTPQNRAKGMGLIGAAFGLGLVIGPFIGGFLSGDDADHFVPGLVACGLSVTAFLAGLFLLKESLTAEKRAENRNKLASKPQSLFSMLRSTGNTLLVCQYFLHNSCVSLATYLFPLWVGSMLAWGPKETGIAFGAVGVLMVIIQGRMIGPLIKRFNELPLLLSCVSLMVVGFAFSSIASGQTQMLAAFFITLSGATCCVPILSSLLSKRSPNEVRGRMMGTSTSASALGRTFGPVAAGTVLGTGNLDSLDPGDFAAAWLVGVVLCGFYISWIISQLRKPAHAISDEH
jgi:MFS family permease